MYTVGNKSTAYSGILSVTVTLLTGITSKICHHGKLFNRCTTKTYCYKGIQCETVQANNKMKTNTTVFGHSRISTHADPKRGPHAGWFIRFWASRGAKFPAEIPCPRCRWTTMQNLTTLALHSVEKSVSVQTHTKNYKTNKQTSSNRYIHTLPIGTCE